MSQLAIHGGRPVRKEFLPPFSPMIGREEIDEVVDTLQSDWITTGPKTHRFEELFREYVGSRHAIALNSCTAGLHLSLAAAGIEAGDEVITTPFTFAATANVIMHQGARPVLVDIDRATYNIDAESIEQRISDRTKAIMPVHYAGQPCDMDRILRLKDKYDLVIIEDAAHALGATYKGKKIGTIGDFTSFSFYATKNLTTVEGGMVTTDSDEFAEKIRVMGLHGISRDAWKRYSSEGSWYYEIMYPGYKYNMTDVQASIGIHQLEKFDAMQERRGAIARMYNEAFEAMPELVTPEVKDYAHPAWHLYALQLNTDILRIGRAEFIEALKAENIGTSVHFIPIHLHPYYRERFGFRKGDFPNAEYVYEHEVSIPLYPKMSDEDVEDVVTAIKKIVEHYRR